MSEYTERRFKQLWGNWGGKLGKETNRCLLILEGKIKLYKKGKVIIMYYMVQ